MKKIGLLFSAIGLFALQSCSINTETTYYKDSAASMESNVLIDKSMLEMVSNFRENKKGSDNSDPISKLSTDWKSLYDIQKNEKLTLNEDSAKVLKKMFLKVNKDKGEIYGLSLKFDKLMPNEIASLLSQSKELKNLPLQNIANWDGKTLTINTSKLNSGDFLKGLNSKQETKIETKSDSLEVHGKQMTEDLLGMMKMFPVNFSNTIKFQKPIKSIVGKHDFVKQIDKKTIQVNLRSTDFLNEKNPLKDNDKQIIITTE